VRACLHACALLWILLCPRPAHAEPETPTVELITIGPGDELFSRWGHIGLRVRADGEDRLYSYGYAVDGGLGQLVALVKGKALFRLAGRRWAKAFPWYQERDRRMEAQPLQLPPAQLRALVERLQIESRPVNRDFVYDSLHTNCSTRLRDLLDDVSGSALRRASEDANPGRTLRTDTRTATANSLLVAIGLDVVVGAAQDSVPTGWAAMYLPADLQATATAATLDSGAPLLGPVEVLIASNRTPPVPPSPAATTWLLVLAAIIAAMIAWARLGPGGTAARRVGPLALAIAGTISGILGLLVAVAMIAATVPSLAHNENVVVFVPLDAVAVVVAVRWWRDRGYGERIRKLGRAYVHLRLGVLAALLVAKVAGLAPQDNAMLILAAAVVLASLAIPPRRSPAGP
jgi:hypothetical protein